MGHVTLLKNTLHPDVAIRYNSTQYAQTELF